MKTTRLLALALVLLFAIPVAAEEGTRVRMFGIGATLPDTDPVIPELESRLGIHIIFEGSTDTTEQAALMARVAGGDIPDIFRVNDINSLSTYYQNDVLLNIWEYTDQIPNLIGAFPEEAWARLTFDGGVYAIPRRAEVNYSSWFIRYDWLEAMGAESPATFGELFDLAMAMNAADLDGNGKDDTFAMTGIGLLGRIGAFNGFFTAYGVAQPNTLMIKDNEPVYTCTLPEFRMALEEIRRFMDAGLMDTEFISNTEDIVREKMATGRSGIAYGGWATFYRQAHQDILRAVYPEAEWGHFLLPIATEHGVSGATMSAAGFSSVYCLSADLAQEPEKLAAALSIFEYTSHGEGDLLMSYGLEGVHYSVENGVIVKQDAMNDLGYGWALQFTGRDDMVYCMTKFAECADEVEYAALEVPIYYHYDQLVQQPDGVNVADLKSYEAEQITQFIYGSRSMDEYDAFIDTLYSVYNLEGYLASAKEQLTALGYLE